MLRIFTSESSQYYLFLKSTYRNINTKGSQGGKRPLVFMKNTKKK